MRRRSSTKPKSRKKRKTPSAPPPPPRIEGGRWEIECRTSGDVKVAEASAKDVLALVFTAADHASPGPVTDRLRELLDEAYRTPDPTTGRRTIPPVLQRVVRSVVEWSEENDRDAPDTVFWSLILFHSTSTPVVAHVGGEPPRIESAQGTVMPQTLMMHGEEGGEARALCLRPGHLPTISVAWSAGVEESRGGAVTAEWQLEPREGSEQTPAVAIDVADASPSESPPEEVPAVEVDAVKLAPASPGDAASEIPSAEARENERRESEPPTDTASRDETTAIEPLSVEPLPVEPLPIEPVSIEPVSIEPLPIEPLSVEALPVEPLPVEPAAVEAPTEESHPGDATTDESLTLEPASVDEGPTGLVLEASPAEPETGSDAGDQEPGALHDREILDAIFADADEIPGGERSATVFAETIESEPAEPGEYAPNEGASALDAAVADELREAGEPAPGSDLEETSEPLEIVRSGDMMEPARPSLFGAVDRDDEDAPSDSGPDRPASTRRNFGERWLDLPAPEHAEAPAEAAAPAAPATPLEAGEAPAPHAAETRRSDFEPVDLGAGASAPSPSLEAAVAPSGSSVPTPVAPGRPAPTAASTLMDVPEEWLKSRATQRPPRPARPLFSGDSPGSSGAAHAAPAPSPSRPRPPRPRLHTGGSTAAHPAASRSPLGGAALRAVRNPKHRVAVVLGAIAAVTLFAVAMFKWGVMLGGGDQVASEDAPGTATTQASSGVEAVAPEAGGSGAVPSTSTGVIVQATFADELGVKAADGARVWIDGEPRGTTPLTMELPSGPHSIRVSYRGREAPVTVVTLADAGMKAVHIRLHDWSDTPRLLLLSHDGPSLLDPVVAISAYLDRVRPDEIKQMALNLGEQGTWHRYPMTLLAAPGGTVGVAVVPANIMKPPHPAPYYVAATRNVSGEQFFTEIQNAVAP